MASSRLERIGTIFTRVEGLITRGAIKPDERPLWFDVYKAFPPVKEPKFAQPKPEDPVRPILYKEDVIRAKFQSQGQGLAVNMVSPGNSQIKRLVKQYEKLKLEGVPETELVEQSIAAVGAERQASVKPAPNKPDAVTSKPPQVLAEADLKNIFKE